MITHLEPDILECEVKWALRSITINKASESDEIPVELFQIVKDDAVKVLHSVCQQIWKAQQGPEDWKRSFFIPVPKKGNAKECSNYCTIALISHTSKVMLKILQARLQQYVNCELPDVQAGFRKGRGARNQIANIHWIIEKAREFQKNIYFCFTDYAKLWKILQARLQQYVNHELPDVQAGFRKGRGTRNQIVNICWIIEKAREFQKNIYFCFIDYAKAFDCVDHKKLWKILQKIEIPDHLSCLLRNL